ncbi:MAG: hypothetical protein GY772_28885 [bacterium]|nr:hypothetical protein [bacterium]
MAGALKTFLRERTKRIKARQKGRTARKGSKVRARQKGRTDRTKARAETRQGRTAKRGATQSQRIAAKDAGGVYAARAALTGSVGKSLESASDIAGILGTAGEPIPGAVDAIFGSGGGAAPSTSAPAGEDTDLTPLLLIGGVVVALVVFTSKKKGR